MIHWMGPRLLSLCDCKPWLDSLGQQQEEVLVKMHDEWSNFILCYHSSKRAQNWGKKNVDLKWRQIYYTKVPFNQKWWKSKKKEKISLSHQQEEARDGKPGPAPWHISIPEALPACERCSVSLSVFSQSTRTLNKEQPAFWSTSPAEQGDTSCKHMEHHPFLLPVSI